MARETEFLNKVVPIIKKTGGRNIVEIARNLHLPVETTRYKIKRLVRNGIGIHASLDYNKVELAETVGIIRLSRDLKSSEKKFFSALAESGYLTRQSKTLPQGSYICVFAVPLKKRIEFNRLIRGLMEAELFETVENYEMSWMRRHMLRSEYYDSDESEWNIDWTRLKKENPQTQEQPNQNETSRYDHLDLFILKELQTDAQTPLADIARRSRTTLNNIFYHFHNHVNKRRLVTSYLLRWTGLTNSRRKHHQNLSMNFIFRDLTHDETKVAINAMRRLPFLWVDAYSIEQRLYYAEATVPLYHYTGLLSFLGEAIEGIAEKLEMYSSELAAASSYPLPIMLYSSSGWNLEPERALAKIKSSVR